MSNEAKHTTEAESDINWLVMMLRHYLDSEGSTTVSDTIYLVEARQKARLEAPDAMEALRLGCLSETSSKENYLAERNALLEQRDELDAALHRLLACPAITLESDEPEDELAINQANAALAKVNHGKS